MCEGLLLRELLMEIGPNEPWQLKELDIAAVRRAYGRCGGMVRGKTKKQMVQELWQHYCRL